MADDLSPLAAALRDAWNSAPTLDDRWMAAATAAREHLSVAPSSAPTERPTCATCPYFSPYIANYTIEGSCRRHAPAWPGQVGTKGNWGIVDPRNWCGDHPDFPAWIANRRTPA